MEAAGWALGVSGVSLVVSVLTVWRTWRWHRAERLLDLHERLRQVKEAALKHVDAEAGEYPTEIDVTGFRERAAYAAERAPWEDVRAAAKLLDARCGEALEPGLRDGPFDRRDKVRGLILEAFDAASAAIGAHANRFR